MTIMHQPSPPIDTPTMAHITIGLDTVRLPTDAAHLVEFVQAITASDGTLTLLRWVNERFAGTDLLAVHNQLVHMESLSDEPDAADGAYGHTGWLDRWECAETELRDLLGVGRTPGSAA